MIIVYDDNGKITQQITGALSYIDLGDVNTLEVPDNTEIDSNRQKVVGGKVVAYEASEIADDLKLVTMRELKMRRVQLLFSSDWTQTSDSPLSDSKKAEWVAYRQALRDLPESYPNETDIDNVVFPTPPES